MHKKALAIILFSYVLSSSAFAAQPDINIVAIDSFPDNQQLPVFGYNKDGNITIDFNVMDEDGGDLTVSLKYSPTPTPATGNFIVQLLNLNEAVCSDNNFFDVTKCNLDFNIHPTLVLDGDYFITATLNSNNNLLTDFDASENSFLVDNTAPAINISFLTSGWTNVLDANHVKFGVSDSGSGVKAVTVIVDGAKRGTFTAGFNDMNVFFDANTNDANHSISIIAQDNADNNSSLMLFVATDKTKPVVTENVQDNIWKNADVNVKISVQDTKSGVKEVWIIKDNVPQKFTAGFSDLNAFFSADGNHSLDINAVDKAGNIIVHPRQFVLVDKTLPEITVSNLVENAWRETSVNVRIEAFDGVSGVREVRITKDGITEIFDDPEEDFEDLNAFFFSDGNHSLDISATDNAGNTLTIPRKFVLIDKAPPQFFPIPVQTIDISQSAIRLVDLFQFVFEEAASPQDLNFAILHESDTNVIDCFIELDRFVSCTSPKKTGSSRITVRARGPSAKEGTTSFDIAVKKSDIVIALGFQEAAITNNDSVGLQIGVKNNASTQKCFILAVNTGSNFVEGSIASNAGCLNPNEETQKTITLTSLNAASGIYPITITASFDGNSFSKTFPLRVSNFSEIEIVQFNQSVCRTGFREISLQIKNNSGKFKRVQLQASNEILLPGIEPKTIGVDAFETRNVIVKIFSSQNTGTGEYRVSVFATTDTEIVKEDIIVRVVDCPPAHPSFTINLQSTGCVELDKNHGTTVNYTIENRLNSVNEINIAVAGALPLNVRQAFAALEPLQSRQAGFDVNALARTEARDYNISLVAWNNNHSTEKSVCIRVREAILSSVELLNNNLAVEQGSNAVFTVLVSNFGDFEEEYDVIAETNGRQIIIALSQDFFTLPKNTQREIYASVSATELAAPGNYDINILITTGTQAFARQLKIEVKQKKVVAGKATILVYPLQVRMLPNEEKTIVVEIRNETGNRVSGMALGISALPTGIIVQQSQGIELLAGETRRISLKAETKQAGTGNYTGMLELAGEGINERKTIEFVVSPQAGITATQSSTGTGSATGLAVFTGTGINLSQLAWLFILAIAVLIILLIFIGLIAGTNRPTREIWLQRRQKNGL